MNLHFWGVRGSIPTPQACNLGFGGNTPCLEIRAGEQLLVFDAGSGFRMLGQSLMERFQDTPLELSLFLTHFHWDHIQGIPYFAPLFNPANRVDLYTSAALGGLRQKLAGQMAAPYFPVGLDDLAGARNYIELDHRPFRIGEVTIQPFPLNHPQGASGYRIETGEGAVVYATDLEHGNPKFDSILREYAQGARVLIYDAQYTPEEYEKRRGWGHSTWREAARTARDARAAQLVLFHHDPGHDDRALQAIVDETRASFENTWGAAEGMRISVAAGSVSGPALHSSAGTAPR